MSGWRNYETATAMSMILYTIYVAISIILRNYSCSNEWRSLHGLEVFRILIDYRFYAFANNTRRRHCFPVSVRPLSVRLLTLISRAVISLYITEGFEWNLPQISYPSRGVATGWAGVDMSTPLLSETIPEIDADPASFFLGGGRVEGSHRTRTAAAWL